MLRIFSILNLRDDDARIQQYKAWIVRIFFMRRKSKFSDLSWYFFFFFLEIYSSAVNRYTFGEALVFNALINYAGVNRRRFFVQKWNLFLLKMYISYWHGTQSFFFIVLCLNYRYVSFQHIYVRGRTCTCISYECCIF